MFELNDDQIAAQKLLRRHQRHTCFVGGSRSGKTSLFIKSVLIRGSRSPASRHLILRQRGNAARASISLDTLPKVTKLLWPNMVLTEHRQDGYFTMPEGAEIWVGGLDDPKQIDKILGREYATILFNECSQMLYASVLTVLTRLAQVAPTRDGPPLRQRAYYDLNPVGKRHWTNVLFGDRRDPIKREPLRYPDDYARAYLSPRSNKKNLSVEYLQALEDLPERQRKRFYEGVYVDEVDGALWTYEGIDIGRVTLDDIPPEKRKRVVVAVDPSGAAGSNDTNADEIGIVAAALGTDDHGYVLEDRSLRDSPAVWGRVAVQMARDYGADCIVAEKNFGGDMVRSVIQAVDPQISVRLVVASRAKVVRAEPVSALYGEAPEYKKIRVHHVGRLPVLEDQMVAATTQGYLGIGSPDHMDAMVYAITELMLASSAEAWISFFKDQSEAASAEMIEKKPDRPTRSDPPTLESIEKDNSVAAAYSRIIARETSKTENCAWCDLPLGGSRATDGADSYHPDCYQVLLKHGKKAEAAE